MSQAPADKFLYFTVGLLKDSDALEALRQDAVKHHMIDNPGQLIALRLSEYYEMMNKGIVQPVVRIPAVISPVETLANMRSERNISAPLSNPGAPISNSGITGASPSYETQGPQGPSTQAGQVGRLIQQPGQPMPSSTYGSPPVSQVTGRMRAMMKEGDTIVSTSSNADQNADDAADYWSVL
jgi:hypothetical protein